MSCRGPCSNQITLNDGRRCPSYGLGTFLSKPEEITEIIKLSIDIGYRLFDCAWLYGNEKEIGEGLRAKIEDKVITRDDIFVVTKLWNTFHEQQKVVPACKESLKNFGLDYVDLYLIHWPCAQEDVGKVDFQLPFKDAVYSEYDIVETWRGMEECVRLGLAKSIGLSNFNSKQVQKIVDNAKIQPVVNQIEVNIFLNNKKLIKFCKDRNIQIMAYSPLGSPTRPWMKESDPVVPLDHDKIAAIGKKYGKTSTQVILRYIYQLGTVPIPKSSNPGRLKQNFEIFDFKLTDDEMDVMDSFNCDLRMCHAEELLGSPEYPFKGVEF
ncbi:aldo-keto reductase 1B isoform X1 [Leptinotarsa decemlineata]|uniref:aldo-keto reductase 1B isoform X1 n=1 Tax=Leptinotarsa decemlineata TaxID=7539 RepID=UPI003D3043AF